MKPLLKWAGGKRAIADEIISRFPNKWNEQTYFEPFFGGGAIYLSINPQKAVISDVNSRLVGFYSNVQKSPELVIAGIQVLALEFNLLESDELREEFYFNLRTKFNSLQVESIESAVTMFGLNKLCFNGLYRENTSGEFNVPFGKKKMFPIIQIDDFLKVSKQLSNTKILNSDFEIVLKEAVAGDFVYLDPPYIPLQGTPSFTSYHSSGFGLNEQVRLASAMKHLGEIGINAMCSNSDTPLTREIYSELNIQQILAPRMVSAKSTGRGSVNELVITNY